ncbi:MULTISPECIES: hypothetical protein [unclassified Shimia]|uniref:hypothetical protein n=1 Tax=unclassified Shimia TaxID=2630038 RepID=UPI003109CB30
MKRLSIFLIFGLVACDTTGEGGFITSGGIRANPVSADTFEVYVRPGNEINQFWCGGGEYASRELGAPSNARLYVVGGAGSGFTVNSPNTIQFSLLPPGQASGASGRVATWGPDLGEEEFVGDARRYCWEGFDRFFP